MNTSPTNRWDVVVVGGGAAGILAAIRAAERQRRTLLLEKNRRPGVKILISGGTRCNLTQATDRRGIVQAFGREQGPFLHSALAALGPQDVVALIEQEGVPTKVEPTGKIFPVSDKATDVLDGLLRRLQRSGAQMACDEGVLQCERHEQGFAIKTTRRTFFAEHLILTTGGKSYPGCGTTGDGYAWAESFGHTIVQLTPALTPITTSEAWVPELKGVTITDAVVRVIESSGESSQANSVRKLAERRGSLLFAHFGLSGPCRAGIPTNGWFARWICSPRRYWPAVIIPGL